MQWVLILVLLIPCPTSQKPIDPDRVSFANGRVSFVPPAGFRPLTQEEINLKFPTANAPRHVYANETLTVSVGITFSAARLSIQELPEFKDAMEQMLPRLARGGLQWHTREIVEINRQRWIHFNFTSHAIDTDVINHMYITAFDGKPLLISFNSVVAEYEKAKKLIEQSRDTIEVRE
jgi:hypothetical protein